MTESPRSAIIKAKPIGHGLDAFRDSSLSLSEELNSRGPATVLDRIGREGLQDHALDLISALLILPASRLLPSSSNEKNLFSDLSRLNLAINAGDFNIEHIVPLIAVVLDSRPDAVIWEKVYELLAELTSARVGKSTTPPPSEPPHTASFQQTPWSFNTGSFEDTSDLRKNVDPILRSEVEDNLRNARRSNDKE